MLLYLILKEISTLLRSNVVVHRDPGLALTVPRNAVSKLSLLVLTLATILEKHWLL